MPARPRSGSAPRPRPTVLPLPAMAGLRVLIHLHSPSRDENHTTILLWHFHTNFPPFSGRSPHARKGLVRCGRSAADGATYPTFPFERIRAESTLDESGFATVAKHAESLLPAHPSALLPIPIGFSVPFACNSMICSRLFASAPRASRKQIESRCPPSTAQTSADGW